MTWEEENQKWLILDGGGGWQVVIPDPDRKPHGFVKNNSNKIEIAWNDCPCKPQTDFPNKMIIHNSFDYQALVESLGISEQSE